MHAAHQPPHTHTPTHQSYCGYQQTRTYIIRPSTCIVILAEIYTKYIILTSSKPQPSSLSRPRSYTHTRRAHSTTRPCLCVWMKIRMLDVRMKNAVAWWWHGAKGKWRNSKSLLSSSNKCALVAFFPSFVNSAKNTNGTCAETSFNRPSVWHTKHTAHKSAVRISHAHHQPAPASNQPSCKHSHSRTHIYMYSARYSRTHAYTQHVWPATHAIHAWHAFRY